MFFISKKLNNYYKTICLIFYLLIDYIYISLICKIWCIEFKYNTKWDIQEKNYLINEKMDLSYFAIKVIISNKLYKRS